MLLDANITVGWDGVTRRELPRTSKFHHDTILLPDGHAVVLVSRSEEWDLGQGERTVNVDGYVEYDEHDQVVRESSLTDAFEPTELPPVTSWMLTTDEGEADWGHANGIIYDEARDSFLITFLLLTAVMSVDRSTGAVEWLLGPGGDFELLGDDAEWFGMIHDPELTDANSVLLFDNSGGISRDESRAVRVDFDTETWTAEIGWEYRFSPRSPVMGSATELENGNVLICAPGAVGPMSLDQNAEPRATRLFEVTQTAEPRLVWELAIDDPQIYRANRLHP